MTLCLITVDRYLDFTTSRRSSRITCPSTFFGKDGIGSSAWRKSMSSPIDTVTELARCPMAQILTGSHVSWNVGIPLIKKV